MAKLGHLADTAADLPELLRWLSMRNRRLIAIDVRLDTATEAGGEDGRRAGPGRRVGTREARQRTRRGLAAARSRGPAGRPAVADTPELRERIVAMREEGMTLQGIADALNEEGVPTIRGGAKWRPSSVQAATGYRRPSAAKRCSCHRTARAPAESASDRAQARSQRFDDEVLAGPRRGAGTAAA